MSLFQFFLLFVCFLSLGFENLAMEDLFSMKKIHLCPSKDVI